MTTEQMEKQIDQIMGRMDLQDKVGQCLTLAFVGGVIHPHHVRYVRELRCGGLRITPHITDMNNNFAIRKEAPYLRPGEYAKLMAELQQIAMDRTSGIPLHMVTDQEGDLSVDFLRGGMSLFPSNMGMTATQDLKLVQKAFRTVGRQLRAQGVNWIHSPEIDVNVQPRNPEIGMRAFSDDPAVCAKYGIAAMKGLMAEGIVPTAKHFPGRGDSVTDAHNALDIFNFDRKRLNAVELHPYIKMIKAGLPCIMTAHSAYTALDPENIPASASRRIVTGLLREEMGFQGVITTDAIGMAGQMQYTGTHANATVVSIEAGNDLVLIKEDEKITASCFYALLDAVKSGRIKESRIDESVRRILRLKAQMNILSQPIPDAAKADKVVLNPRNAEICRETYEKAAIIVRDRDQLLPLKPEAKIMVVEQYIPVYHVKSNDRWYHPGMFGETMRGLSPNTLYLETQTPPDEADMQRFEERIAQVDTVVFFNIFWRGSCSNRPLIREAVKRGKKVIVATNDLYDSYFLPTAGTVICTFGAVPQGTKMAADIIYGKAKAGGTWPLKQLKQTDMVPEDEIVDHATSGHFAKL